MSQVSPTASSPKPTSGTAAHISARTGSPPLRHLVRFWTSPRWAPRIFGPARDRPRTAPLDSAPLDSAFPANGGPPPHLDHWAHVWDTLTAQQRADLARPSLHEVEEGLARTHVAASAATDPDRHAIDLGTAEHDRVAAPLLSRLSVLRGHRATAHTALLECQARVAAIDTQQRSTAAALSAEEAPPVGTLPARHSMQPPAPRESRDSSAPSLWSVVARRPPQQDNRPAQRTARYLELPVSKFMFRNKAFPSELRVPIKDHATEVHETLLDLTGKRYRLDRALALATKGNTPLSKQVVNATLRLRDLLDAACGTLPGEHWLLDTLRAFEMARANRSESSLASDSSAPTGQRRREEPSSGRGNAKRTTFSGSDSDSAPHPRRTERDRRQVPPVIFHAVETDNDTPSFPPRIFRPRVTQRLPSRAPISSTVHDLSSTVHGSDAASAPSLKQMVEAVTAAAIAAVDRHLERLGLCIAPTVPHLDSAATTAPPPAVAPHTVSPVERTVPVAPYTAPVTHSTHPAMTPPGTVLPSVAPRTSVAPRIVPPLARSAPVATYTDPMTHPTYPATPSPGTVFSSAASRPVPHPVAARTIPPVIPYTGSGSVPHPPYIAMTSPSTVHPFTSSGSIAPPPPPIGTVYPPNYATMASRSTVPPLARPASVAPPPPSLGTVNPYIYTTANPAPVPTLPPPPGPAVPAERDAPPPDERLLNDDCSSLTSNSSNPLHLRADFVASLQAAYRTLDMRRVPRVQPLQFPPSADRTAATQLLIRAMRDALSGIFDVADPSGTVTLTSPVWVHGWHAPLLKLTKAAIAPNRDDTHDLHRLIDDIFSQLQERMTSGASGPVAFKTLLTDFADHFDRAPRGAALATLQNFGVCTGTPFASYLRALRVVVASTVEKGGPLAPSSAMAIELVRIRTAQ